MSCQSIDETSLIKISVKEIAKPVLYIIQYDEYNNGVFIPLEDWKNWKINTNRKNEEIKQLRNELTRISTLLDIQQ